MRGATPNHHPFNPTPHMTTHHTPLEWGEADERILRALSRHSFMTYKQLTTVMSELFGKTPAQTRKRLRALRDRGLVIKENQLAPYQITKRGLNAIDSELPVPRVDGQVLSIHHSMVIDLIILLESRIGLTTLTEREILYEDAPPRLPLLCKDPVDPTIRYRPDFVIINDDGSLFAVEYERIPKSRLRLNRKVEALDRSPSYARCIYITEPAAANPVSDAIKRTGAASVYQVSLEEVQESLKINTLPSIFESTRRRSEQRDDD
jgi:DNA-binding transcriptional ArsR family regulator